MTQTTTKADVSYKSVLRDVLSDGEFRDNRTGIATYSLTGQVIKADLRGGFPATTLKKLYFGSVTAELCGFLQGAQSAADFRALGTKIWDANANETQSWLSNPARKGADDLGPIYGSQWRSWQAFKKVTDDLRQALTYKVMDKLGWSPVLATVTHDLYSKRVDQLAECIRLIKTNPNSRRILFHAWNPADVDFMALPPCHVLYQFHPNPETGVMGLTLYLRSNDLALGTPFNMASAGLLLALVSRLTGYTPGVLTLMIGDAHIYYNLIPMVEDMLSREAMPAPTLKINDRIPVNPPVDEAIRWLDWVTPNDFHLENYNHHPAISGKMAA